MMMASANTSAEEESARFEATHKFQVKAPVATVFPLFFPENESRWLPPWNPTPIFPSEVHAEENAVFKTGSGDDEAIWTIVSFEPSNFTIEYLVVDADFQQRRVIVRCRDLGGDESTVSVTYVTTALSPEGAKHLKKYNVDFIQEWEAPVREVAMTGMLGIPDIRASNR